MYVVAVQHERGPRHTTLRRHISFCLKNSPPPQPPHPAIPHRLDRASASSLSAAAVALAACTPPPARPPPSLYQSPIIPITPMNAFIANCSSNPSGSVFNFLNSHLLPANNAPLPYALTDVSCLSSFAYCRFYFQDCICTKKVHLGFQFSGGRGSGH